MQTRNYSDILKYMHLFRPNSGWCITFFLCAAAVILWFWETPNLSLHFNSLPLTITSLAQLTGLVGLVLFSLSIFLSGRFSFTETLFGGMNRVYIAHHQIGGIAFLLLLVHPLLIAASFLPFSLSRAASQLLPGISWPQTLGLAGLFFLMSLMVFTYHVTLPYQIWRFTHKFMGAAFFLGGLHSFFIPSTISRFIPLRIYMLTLCLIALASYLYRTLLGRLLIKRYVYVVESVKNVGNQTIEMLLYPAQSPLPYTPGQFIFIGFPKNPVLREVHPFSISSSPKNQQLRVSAKALGDYTTKLLSLQKGTVAQVEGPYGRFSYTNYFNHRQVWVGGGIGITPFLSMAQNLTPDYTVYLYYCVKDQEEAVYLDELKTRPGLRVIPFFSKTQGRISAEIFQKDLGSDFPSFDFFICGPPPMMKSLRAGLTKLKISHARIHTEEFTMN